MRTKIRWFMAVGIMLGIVGLALADNVWPRKSIFLKGRPQSMFIGNIATSAVQYSYAIVSARGAGSPVIEQFVGNSDEAYQPQSNGVLRIYIPTNGPLTINAASATNTSKIGVNPGMTNMYGASLASNTLLVVQKIIGDAYWLTYSASNVAYMTNTSQVSTQVAFWTALALGAGNPSNTPIAALASGDLVWPMHMIAELPLPLQATNTAIGGALSMIEEGMPIFRGEEGRPVAFVVVGGTYSPTNSWGIKLISGRYE